jgi:hypothetical protein
VVLPKPIQADYHPDHEVGELTAPRDALGGFGTQLQRNLLAECRCRPGLLSR